MGTTRFDSVPAPARATARVARRTAARFCRRPYWQRPDPRWLVRRWPGLLATCAASVFFWLSLTPSLVPRPWYLQGVIGGITAAIGYALGASADWLVRLLAAAVRHAAARRQQRRGREGRERHRRESREQRGQLRASPFPRAFPRRAFPRPLAGRERWRARAWLAYYVLAVALTAVSLSESARMQRELRALQELPETLTWHSLMITLITVAVAAALVLLARTVRLGTRELIRMLCRFVPRPVAVVAGLLISVTAVVVGSRDVVFERGVSWTNGTHRTDSLRTPYRDGTDAAPVTGSPG